MNSYSPSSPKENGVSFSNWTVSKMGQICESHTPNSLNIFSNYLRKNYERFTYVHSKNALVALAPRKHKDECRTFVVGYNSGYFVSCSVKDNLHGTKGPMPKLNNLGHADWLRKKLRSHDLNPSCAENGTSKTLMVMGRIDIIPPKEIFLEELHDFLTLEFPSWNVIYDPEVFPCMTLCRSPNSLRHFQKYGDHHIMGQNKSPPCDNYNSRISSDQENFKYKQFNNWPNSLPSFKLFSSGDIDNSEDDLYPSFTNELLLPIAADMKINWPDKSDLDELHKLDIEFSTSEAPYKGCVFVLGVKQILIHGANSQEDVLEAIDELWKFIKNFVDDPASRFTVKRR